MHTLDPVQGLRTIVIGRAFSERTDRRTRREERTKLCKLGKEAGAGRIWWPRLAERGDFGRWTIYNTAREKEAPCRRLAIATPPEAVNGVILWRPREAVAMVTRDCPTLVLHHPKGGPTAVLHCGRDMLHACESVGDTSIIERAMRTCSRAWQDLTAVEAYVFAGISAEHFCHDTSDHKFAKMLKHFEQCWGPNVVPDRRRGTVDLFAIMRHQLIQNGVREENIRRDGIDTYTHPDFASRRGIWQDSQEGGHNLVLTVKLA